MGSSKTNLIYASIFTVSALFTGGFLTTTVVGQGPPPARYHTEIQSNGASTLSSTERLSWNNRVSIEVRGGERVIKANGIPSHAVGRFPNRGNPHSIEQQDYEFTVPARPEFDGRARDVGMRSFGVAVNGVPFDPSAAEWYKGYRNADWRYEALSGAIALGVDDNYAHVQPGGLYHYHGLPRGLLGQLNVSDNTHSPLVGWAADGFPIYAIYSYANGRDSSGGIKALKSSYRVKNGSRPDGFGDPGGRYDGTFVADCEFVKGAGDLDSCNGKRVSTPEFTGGTYAYFLTETWPVIPRCYNAPPDRSFAKGPRVAVDLALRGGFGPPPGGPPPGGGFGPPPHPPRF